MPELLMVNPRKRRAKKRVTKKRKTTIAVRKRRSPSRTRTKRRRNPIARRRVSSKGIGGMVANTLIPGATAAGGALALDVIWGMLPIPENLKTGPIRHVAKAAGAVGIGMLAGMFAKPATASLIATGAMTVVMHNAGREMLAKVAPNLTLGEYQDDDGMGYAGAGWMEDGELTADSSMGEYMGEYQDEGGMGLYEPGDISEMGAYDEDEIDL